MTADRTLALYHWFASANMPPTDTSIRREHDGVVGRMTWGEPATMEITIKDTGMIVKYMDRQARAEPTTAAEARMLVLATMEQFAAAKDREASNTQGWVNDLRRAAPTTAHTGDTHAL